MDCQKRMFWFFPVEMQMVIEQVYLQQLCLNADPTVERTFVYFFVF